jgi:uncharacterized protein YdhG (YjbR/CyaY superfamily)
MTTKTKKPRSKVLSAEERIAMKDRIAEMKGAGEGVKAVLAKIAQMSEPDRSMAKRVHALVTAAAPELDPKTWYGMPAYAKDGTVVCFFKPGTKFKARYATFGFSDRATLDDGAMWPTEFALTKLTPASEAQLTALVRKAVS